MDNTKNSFDGASTSNPQTVCLNDNSPLKGKKTSAVLKRALTALTLTGVWGGTAALGIDTHASSQYPYSGSLRTAFAYSGLKSWPAS